MMVAAPKATVFLFLLSLLRSIQAIEGKNIANEESLRLGSSHRNADGDDNENDRDLQVMDEYDWVQRGNQVCVGAGVDIEPFLGSKTIALNSNGMIIAACRPDVTRVFELQNGDTWVQRGVDLPGAQTVALSQDGAYIAMGSREALNDFGQVKVFQYNSNLESYVQKGDSIDGTAPNEQCGKSIDLAMNGVMPVVAVGCPSFNEPGKVRVYEYITGGTNNWVTKGDDIQGEDVPGVEFGEAVSLSGIGNRIHITAPQGQAPSSSGNTFTYDYDDSDSTWKPYGPTLPHGGTGDSVSSGWHSFIARLAVTDPVFQGGGTAHIYQYDVSGNAEEVFAVTSDDSSFFGMAVSMSKDAGTVAMAWWGVQRIIVHVVEHDEAEEKSIWRQKGRILDKDDGHESGGFFGEQVELSSDGNSLAVMQRDPPNDKVCMRVYEYADVNSPLPVPAPTPPQPTCATGFGSVWKRMGSRVEGLFGDP